MSREIPTDNERTNASLINSVPPRQPYGLTPCNLTRHVRLCQLVVELPRYAGHHTQSIHLPTTTTSTLATLAFRFPQPLAPIPDDEPLDIPLRPGEDAST